MAFLDLSSAAILAATIGIPWMLIIGFLHLGLSDGPNFSAACTSPTMEQGPAAVLSARPAFLLTAELPDDGLLRSPARFAGSPKEACVDGLFEVLKVVKSRAFKREFEAPPARFRSQARSAQTKLPGKRNSR
jgi:hypothetical protein